jgi:hypothetical protein
MTTPSEYTGHSATVEKYQGGWRWVCTTAGCRQKGSRVPTKRRALDGAGYHEYSARPMTADEVLTLGDGMNADLSRAEAQKRADAFNRRLAEGR